MKIKISLMISFVSVSAMAASPAPQIRMQMPQYQNYQNKYQLPFQEQKSQAYKRNYQIKTASGMSTDQRLARLERILESQALLEITSQIEQLQREISELRGKVEELTFSNKQLSEQQRNTYVDLDGQIQQIKERLAQGQSGTGPRIPSSNESGQSANTKPPADPKQARSDYSAAVNMIRAKRYTDAVKALRIFVEKYPTSKFAGKAQFWLGELNYIEGRYDIAVVEYGKLISKFSKNQKLPKAMLKQGYSYYQLKNWSKAKQSLQMVTQRYPNTTEAKLAKQKLNQIRRERH